MAETRLQDLSPHDRRDALEVAERNSSHKAHVLERDVWVVATLRVLFDAPFAGNLILKGGTSLSKMWHAIRRFSRFSEDIDITSDIRAFASDLVSGAGDAAGISANALNDRTLAFSVARRNAMFFVESDTHGNRIDYEAAVLGGLQLISSGAAHAVLADDYARMLADGMLLDENEPFDALMERCAAIETKTNAGRPGNS